MDVIADGHDLDHCLVPEREAVGPRRPGEDEERVDLAASHRQRTHQRVSAVAKLGLGHVAPLDDAGRCTRELTHI